MGKSAVGYQKWLLLAHPWVPTVGGPGEERFRRPEDVWVDVPRGAARAVLASPTVTPPDARAVGFASVHKPELSRLENALLAVEATYKALADAPPATRDGLSWLLKKIDAAAARANRGGGSALRWPATQDSQPAWSESPLIADVPGISQAATIAWLPNAPWPGLQSAYGLRRASTAVTTSVDSRPAQASGHQLLSHDHRTQLLALLLEERGAEVGSLAFRLGNLDEHRVASLQVTYRFDDRTWEDGPSFHLEQRRDSRGRLRGARLISKVDLDSTTLVLVGQALSQYLDVAGAGDLIGLYLTSRDAILRAHNVLPTQLTEAEEAMRRYRTGIGSSEIAAETEGQAAATADETIQTVETGRAGDVVATTGPSVVGARAPAGPDGDAAAQRGAGVVSRPGIHSSVPPSAAGNAPSRQAADKDASPQRRLGHVNVVFGTPERRLPRSGHPGRTLARGGRPRTGERSGAGTTGELSESEAVDRRATEIAAEDIASRYLAQHYAARVERVGHLNVGWDLTATLPDGNSLHVEVKGFAGTSPDFIITRGERSAAQSDPTYRVCIVTGVGGSAGNVSWIEDMSSLLTEDFLDPLQWVVRDWSRVGPMQSTWTGDE